jgi:hypothetical protein
VLTGAAAAAAAGAAGAATATLAAVMSMSSIAAGDECEIEEEQAEEALVARVQQCCAVQCGGRWMGGRAAGLWQRERRSVGESTSVSEWPLKCVRERASSRRSAANLLLFPSLLLSPLTAFSPLTVCQENETKNDSRIVWRE